MRKPESQHERKTEVSPDKILTLPNGITVVGGAASLLGIMLSDSEPKKALPLLVAGAASDALDGAVARATGQQSEFGAKLDPVRDKIIALTAAAKVANSNDPNAKKYAAAIFGLESAKATATCVAEHNRRNSDSEKAPLRPTKIGKVSSAAASIALTASMAEQMFRMSGHEKAASAARTIGRAAFAAYIPAALIATSQYTKRAFDTDQQHRKKLSRFNLNLPSEQQV